MRKPRASALRKPPRVRYNHRTYVRNARARQTGPRGPRSQVEPALGDGGDLPLRSHRAARTGLRHRHAAADGERLAARRARLLLHPHRRHRALPAHVRQGRVLPDGVGRQRAADRTAGPELLRRPLRSVAAVRPDLRAAGEAGQAGDLGVAAELHRAVRAPDRRGREGVRGAVAAARPVGRLVDDLRDDQPRLAARVAARLPQPAAQGPRLPARGADAVGRRLPHRRRPGRARGSRAAGRVPQAALRPSTAAIRSRSRRRGPSCCRPASRWSRIPTTSATSRCSAARCGRRSSTCPCRSSRIRWPAPTRAPASR